MKAGLRSAIRRLVTLCLLVFFFASWQPVYAACLPQPSGVLSWWNFQYGGNDIFGPNSVYIEGYPFDNGKVGLALFNDGTAVRLQTSSTDFPVGNADRTMALWVNLSQHQATGTSFFAGYGDPAKTGEWYALGAFAVDASSNSKRLFFTNNGFVLPGPVLEIGTWYHVAVTNTGNSVKLYLNGIQVATGASTIATATDSQFSAGYRDAATRMVGYLDEIQLFDRALTATEIQNIFTSDSSGLCYQLDIAGTFADGTSGIYYSKPLPMNSIHAVNPYVYAITGGSLPPGLSLSYGAIVGVPTTEGTFNFTATVIDALSGSGNASYTITIYPAPPVSPQLGAATWHSIGPFTSEARAFAIDPRNSQNIYAGTKNGIYKSTNGGASWLKSDSGITDLYVRTIIIDPTDSNIMYAGTDDGVYKSIDRGDTWIRSLNGIPPGEGVESLAFDPTNSAKVYAGAAETGLYRSNNSGAVWENISNGTDIRGIRSIVLDPADPATIYVSKPFGSGGGLFISRNGGGSWTNSTGIPDDIRQVILDPANSANVYATSLSAGVFVSTDKGNTWQARNSGLENDLSIYSIAIHPTMPQILYAGSQFNSYLYKSVNGGASWVVNTTGKSNIRLITFDPVNPSVMYVGYDDNGFIKTVNGGMSWSLVNNGMANTRISSLAIDPDNSQTVYVTTMTSLHKSTNGGQTWSAPLHDGWQVVIDPGNSATLYLTSGEGVYKSFNGGTTWQLLAGSPVNGSLYSAPSDGQTLYFSNNDGIYRTTNGGTIWSLLAGTQGMYMAAIDPHDSKSIFATNLGPNLYISSNGGDSWTSSFAPSDLFIIDPNDTMIMYGRGNGMVVKSVDGGLNWAAIGSGLPELPVVSLAFDPYDSSIIYAGTDGNGVFVTINGGDSWSQFNKGLPVTASVYYLAVDPSDSRIVYAGTDISGAYKTSSSTTPLIEAPVAANFNEGQAGSFRVVASGWPTPALKVSGTLPDGLLFDAATGIVSGTPDIGTVSTDPYILMFSADNGRPPAAARGVAVYVLDTSNLLINITAPAHGVSVELPLASISGTASSGETVEVQVTDGSLYLQDNSFTTNPAWLPAYRSGANWTVTINPTAAWQEGLTYTIIARVVGDSTKTVTSTFRIAPSALKDETILSAAFAKNSIRSGDTATISGRLEALDSTGLTGKNIDLIITPPSTDAEPLPDPIIITVTTTNTTAPQDNFTSGALSLFATPGIYTVEVRFRGDGSQQAASLSLSLPVIAHSGYAVIVVGKTANNSLLTEHKATAQAIKNILINKRGFLSGNITSVISSASAAKTKDDISTALSDIKTKKYVAKPAPVYLIMIDHGSPDPGGGFIMGSQTLLPSELGTMLDNFESGIDPAVLADNRRFIIVGTCYSGLFQSLSKPGRVIITSSASTEQSLAGSVSYSGTTASVGGGDFFVDTLFSFLGRGDSFANAFNQAANAVALRDPRSVPIGIHSGVMDSLAQHPLLDDDGKIPAAYDLSGATDGQTAATLYLGEGVRVPAGGNPTDITDVAVAPSNILEDGTSVVTLSLQVNDNSRVDSAWIEIRTPDTTASSDGTGQVIPGGLDSMPLIYDGQKWVGDYTGITTAGTYHIYFYTRDNLTGEMSPMAHSVVYKKKVSNAKPAAFSLTAPADATNQYPPFVMSWEASSDNDGLTYTLLVATDQNFNTIIHREENLAFPMTILQDSALRDPAASGAYYCQNRLSWCWWKVQAIDSFGETTESGVRNFTIVKTNAQPTMVKALVTTGGVPISGASCSVSTGNTVSSVSGACLMTAFSMPATVTVSAPYHVTQSSISVPTPNPISNVSSLTAPVNLVANTLTTTLGGTGSGTVNCSTIEGSVNCTGPIKYNFTVTLSATPDWKSQPGTWGGSCGGSLASNCVLTINGPKSVTANFNPHIQAKVGIHDCSSLTEAYGFAIGVDTIKAVTGYVFHENLLMNQDKTVTIDGGYSDLSNSNGDGVGSTILQGSGDHILTINNGRLNARGLKIR